MSAVEPSPVGKPLPYADAATIPDGKLTDYVLNPDHPQGQHKARVFSSALGINQSDADFLAGQILAELRYAPVAAAREAFAGGTVFTVPITVTGRNNAEHAVITAWFLEEGGNAPRLVTAYVEL